MPCGEAIYRALDSSVCPSGPCVKKIMGINEGGPGFNGQLSGI